MLRRTPFGRRSDWRKPMTTIETPRAAFDSTKPLWDVLPAVSGISEWTPPRPDDGSSDTSPAVGNLRNTRSSSRTHASLSDPAGIEILAAPSN